MTSAKFFCEICAGFVDVDVEHANKDELNAVPWGDIVCKECHVIIGTYQAKTDGILEFVPDSNQTSADIRQQLGIDDKAWEDLRWKVNLLMDKDATPLLTYIELLEAHIDRSERERVAMAQQINGAWPKDGRP